MLPPIEKAQYSWLQPSGGVILEFPSYPNWKSELTETSWNEVMDVSWRPKDSELKPKTSRMVPLGRKEMLEATRVTTCSMEREVSKALVKAF